MSSPPASRNTTTIPHDASQPATHGAPTSLQSPVETASTTALSSSTRPHAPSSTPPLFKFQTATIAPSPPAQQEIFPRADDPKTPSRDRSLRISTDLSESMSTSSSLSNHRDSLNDSLSPARGSQPLKHRTSSSSLIVSRTPSLKTALANSYGSGNGSHSAIPSPIITAMGDMTPLPSPLLSGDSPGPWKRLNVGAGSPPQSRARLRSFGEGSALVTSSGEPLEAAAINVPKRKIYASLDTQGATPPRLPHQQAYDQSQQQSALHSKNRSVSEYVPDPAIVPKKTVTVSGSHMKIETSEDGQNSHIRRESNYAESRGLTPTVTKPPTPPPSESARDSVDGSSRPQGSRFEYFEARGRDGQKRRRWRSIGFIGQGTFSRVMLATSQMTPNSDVPEPPVDMTSPVSGYQGDRRALVAVKVCEHGPRGGASEDRVEMSLKRELEIMKSIHHPSLVDLKAWSIEPTRAILVLSYCPGGDLFDVATATRNLLTPPLLRRIFAELIEATRYLHERRIVHRDIKLENVLVNLTPAELGDSAMDWTTYPYSVVTLADLGLSRRIADDEKLETRCGSDDYAAPEVIMGQSYDGRATDAWSLGVLLYALLEARLPFDPHPGMSDAHRMRSRTSHRIARVEWRWVEYAGDDGDHEGDDTKFEAKGLLGAMRITEGLLKRARSRWGVDKVAEQPWVRDAVVVEGGLRFREEDEGEEVL